MRIEKKARLCAEGTVMSFGIYLAGFVVVIAGLIYGAVLMHMPTHWIVVGGLVLVGLGILTGVKATRQKDSAT
jgi:cadmium resistance protein CadD (predicted permease)